MAKERKRYGVWQFWLSKGMQGFRPILARVAKRQGLRESEVIREAVCMYLAKHDDDAASLYRAWKELEGE
jgi:hypothetical protein